MVQNTGMELKMAKLLM